MSPGNRPCDCWFIYGWRHHVTPLINADMQQDTDTEQTHPSNVTREWISRIPPRLIASSFILPGTRHSAHALYQVCAAQGTWGYCRKPCLLYCFAELTHTPPCVAGMHFNSCSFFTFQCGEIFYGEHYRWDRLVNHGPVSRTLNVWTNKWSPDWPTPQPNTC